MVDPQVLEELKKYDTPSITNVVATYPEHPLCLGLYNPWSENWYTDQTIHCMYPELGALCGYAVTCVFGLPDPTFKRLTFMEIVDALDSPNIRLTLDTGHAHIHDGIPDAIAAFGDRLHHLQVHDAINGRDHQEIGTGEITPEFYADIIENEKVPLVVIETSARRGGVPALLRSRDFLKEHFGDSLT